LEAAGTAADNLAAATEELTAAAAEEVAAEGAAVREELLHAERRLQREFTEGLAGEAGMREQADAAATIKLEQGLETESNARAAAADAMAADAATREEALRAESAAAADALRQELLAGPH